MIDVTLSFPFLVYVFEGLAGTWEGNKKKESALSTCHDHRDTLVGFTGETVSSMRGFRILVDSSALLRALSPEDYSYFSEQTAYLSRS
jgi:hypothetical protein